MKHRYKYDEQNKRNHRRLNYIWDLAVKFVPIRGTPDWREQNRRGKKVPFCGGQDRV